MMHVGDIMSTVEGIQYRGGKSLLLFEYPTVLNTPHGTHDIPPHVSRYPPTCITISPHSTKISKDDCARKDQCRVQTERFFSYARQKKKKFLRDSCWSDKTVLERVFLESTSFIWPMYVALRLKPLTE